MAEAQGVIGHGYVWFSISAAPGLALAAALLWGQRTREGAPQAGRTPAPPLWRLAVGTLTAFLWTLGSVAGIRMHDRMGMLGAQHGTAALMLSLAWLWTAGLCRAPRRHTLAGEAAWSALSGAPLALVGVWVVGRRLGALAEDLPWRGALLVPPSLAALGALWVLVASAALALRLRRGTSDG